MSHNPGLRGHYELQNFCAELKQLRIECGDPKLAAVAEVSPIRRAQLSDVFNGKIKKPPSWDVVEAIVKACRHSATAKRLKPSLPLNDSFWREQLHQVTRAFTRPTEPAAPVPDGWIELAQGHPAWRRTEDAASMQEKIVPIVQRLADRRIAAEAQLTDDPWLDFGLPDRMLSTVEGLLGMCGAEDTFRLSAAETALILLTPMLYHVASLETAAEFLAIGPTNLDQTSAAPGSPRSSYERFLISRPHHRMVTRAQMPDLADRSNQSVEIGWWLYHRWLTSREPRISANPVDGLIQDGQLRRVLAEPLLRLVRLLHLPTDDLRNPDRDHLSTALGSVRGWTIRERLNGLLLVTAHSMSIELQTLSSTIVEHLGIPEAVSLDELRQTLDAADWQIESPGIVLNARCRHEAVLEALTEHCNHTDDVLRAAHSVAARDTTAQVLQALPASASADNVQPESVDGEAIFVVPPTKFSLDETRVRELLMGEQLYRDRSLAIRELYQNALDACRYRKARHEYRQQKGQPDGSWQGRIEFEQGVDGDGRAYLICRDNGVGMGKAELSDVFSQAGVRFADRLEFAEEQAQWSEQGVFLYPNSRFGIGVMSYFMLADEIEVTSCRMSRDERRAGPVLKVFIAGPGHLFRIKEIAEHGDDPGTEIKLYLRPDEEIPSCVRTLRTLLGIAEFETVAEHDGSQAEWLPNEFRPRERQPWEEDGINAYGSLEPAAPGVDGQVVWCQFGGALLVDGIYVRASQQRKILQAMNGEPDPRGAVINITGARAPALTVDRMSVFEDISAVAEDLLRDATKTLHSHQSRLLSYSWILDIGRESPGIADLVAASCKQSGTRLELSDRMLPINFCGVTALDSELYEVHNLAGEEVGNNIRHHWRVPDHLLLWRLLALLDNPLGNLSDIEPKIEGRILPATPSDSLIIINLAEYGGNLKEKSLDSMPPGPVVKSCIDLGVGEDSILKRMSLLNIPSPRTDTREASPYHPADLILLSRAADGKPPWLPVGPVDITHLIASSVHLKTPITHIAARLKKMGYGVPETTDLPRRIEDADLRLISASLDSKWPWISTKSPIQFQHAVRAALKSHQEIEPTMERIKAIKLLAPEDRSISSRLQALNSQEKEMIFDLIARNGVNKTPRAEVAYRATKAGFSIQKARDLLTNIGYNIEDLSSIGNVIEKDRAILDSLDMYLQVISLGRILDISLKVGLPPGEVASRLEFLGFEVVARPTPEAVFDSTDWQALKTATYWSMSTHISLKSIIESAANAECSPHDVTDRLQSLGLTTDSVDGFPDSISETDLKIMHRSVIALSDLLPREIEVPIAQILRAAHMTRLLPVDIGRKLARLGYQVPSNDKIPPYCLESDIRLLSWRGLWTATEWQDPYKPVTMANLIRAAIRCRVSITAAAKRFEELGCKVPELTVELPPLLALVPIVRSVKPTGVQTP